MTNPLGLTDRSYALHCDPAGSHRTWLTKYGDKTTPKYFVYFLIGRSVNPETRRRAHQSNQAHPNKSTDTSSWFPLVDHMEVIGPFPWDEAVAVEREEIGKHQPLANRDLTARDHRPAIAAKSQLIRDEYLRSLRSDVA